MRTFSGITFHVLEQLREPGVEVEVISPCGATFATFWFPRQFWHGYARGVRAWSTYRFPLRPTRGKWRIGSACVRMDL